MGHAIAPVVKIGHLLEWWGAAVSQVVGCSWAEGLLSLIQLKFLRQQAISLLQLDYLLLQVVLNPILGPDLRVVLHVRLLQISILGFQQLVLLHELLPP